MLASWLDEDDAAVETPAVPVTPTPVPPPVVTPPAEVPSRLKRKVAPAWGVRGFGIQSIVRGAVVTVLDTHVEGYTTNVSIEHAASVTVRNLRSVRAWRDDPTPTDAKLYNGQGIYLDDIAGVVVVRESLFGWNGWQWGHPLVDRTQYRHGAYNNFGCLNPLYEDCILVGNPACGGQFRGGGTCRRCVFLDNGVGVLASMGNLVLEDCLIYGGNYFRVFDSKGEAWTGMAAITAYWPVTARGELLIAARPGQAAGDATVKATGNRRLYPAPAIQASRQGNDPAHREWHQPPAGAALFSLAPGATCTVAGWPAGPYGGGAVDNLFAARAAQAAGKELTPAQKAALADKTALATEAELKRVRVRPNPVAFDYGPILDAVLSEPSVA
jgi:hypothetical protein